MKLSSFRFNLPENLIASHPTKNRDDARMMVVHRKEQKIEHKKFKDLLKYFNDKDVMVFNNTKVFNARLYGSKEKTGAKIEVFLLRELNKEMRLWDVLVDPARKIRVGNKLYFGDNEALVAEVVDNTTSRGRTIRFLFDGNDEELWKTIEALGEPPLPKYINRPVEAADKDRFQTIFAKHTGAVAAPNAGLHFSREMMMRLEIKGLKFAELTLHVGLGSFRPVEVEDLTKHKMDSESFDIQEECCKIVNNAIEEKRRICAVGTTAMRALESSVSSVGRLNPASGWTDKFIFPPYEFSIANSLLTNFHHPESTLLMMLSAYLGYDYTMHCYNEAMKEKYRFLAYGDAMLVI
jgi:S-adenosylmethionine:tRNA ribosyltransferase-isomerase